MNTKKVGDSYEDFVANVYQMISLADQFGKTETIKIERNKKISDKRGNIREIDIYWEYMFMDQKYSTAVECKNYNSTITMEKVDAFVTKIQSLNISKGIMVTKTGFQSGAKSSAKEHGISLITIRKPNDEDFAERLTKIHLNICIKRCPIIVSNSIELSVDNEWIEENIPDFDGKIHFDEYNCNIYVTNFYKGKTFSFHDIENKFLCRDICGEHTYKNDFTDSYLIIKDKKIKITHLGFKYYVPPHLNEEIIRDFSDYLYAIMEYVGEEHKKIALLKTGERKDFE